MIKFISFADKRMRHALSRIKNQAEAMQIFDIVEVFDETTLMPDLAPWAHILHKGTKGFGYYCWKSYLVYRELSRLSDNDILFFCDAGCHLNPRGRERFLDYIEITKADALGVKLFAVDEWINEHPITERLCTKGDVFDHFNCRDCEDITDSPQMAGGHILCRKCPRAMALLEEWLRTWQSDISLIDDSPSRSANLPGFRFPRHDQSIISVLYKKSGGTPLPRYECYTRGDWEKELGNCPVWDIRDRGRRIRPLMRLWALWVLSLCCPVSGMRAQCRKKMDYTLMRRPYLKDYLPRG